jgi:NAD(P)-dependent dehydrogenase (short-subunit alcohol dehydrogenase family)
MDPRPDDAPARPLVVVTGAAGHVGQLTSQALAGRDRLRLIDLEWPVGEPDAEDGTERLALDLSHRHSWDKAIESADAVVHLAGHPYPGIDARTAVESGAMLTAELAAAAAGSGVKRIVFASSIHTMGLHHRHGAFPISQQWPARPCCEYGAAKLFSENLLQILTERTPISVVCLRLGLTGFPPGTEVLASQWLGPRDYAQLLHASLTAPVRYGTYLGMSAGAARRWDLAETIRDLGFHSIDSAPVPELSPETGEEPAPPHCLMFQPAPVPPATDPRAEA